MCDVLDSADVANERIRVGRGARVARAGQPIHTLYLPCDAIILIARQTERDPVPLTVGLIGAEGIVGWQALLMVEHWTHDAIAVTPGELCAVERTELQRACGADAALNRLLLLVAHNHALQLAQSVVANLGHSVERRLARWLLMLHDRSRGDILAVTHDQLAQLLNVRRATVTDALHVLEGDRAIRSTRGRVEVRDRTALLVRAAQSYGLSEGDYQAAIGPFGKGSAGEQA